MRYVCSICGYIYDEGKENIPFSELPESWRCPLCSAAKALFAPEKQAEGSGSAAVPPAGGGDMRELTAGELAALCSNLSRGCEKQYLPEEASLFQELADYFTAAAPAVPEPDAGHLLALLQADLNGGYPSVSSAAKAAGDRGTQRVCVWGEKVTLMLVSLLQRYQQEGGAFLRNTRIWVCSVCGFVYLGDTPPNLCPVCKVPAWKFDQIEGRTSA